jgi:hypothetical protein
MVADYFKIVKVDAGVDTHSPENPFTWNNPPALQFHFVSGPLRRWNKWNNWTSMIFILICAIWDGMEGSKTKLKGKLQGKQAAALSEESRFSLNTVYL